MAQARPAVDSPPFPTRAALLAWLEQHGIGHVARLCLEVVAPRVEPSAWAALRQLGARRRLLDLASADAVAQSVAWMPVSPLREALPPVVAQFLEDERADAAVARLEVPDRMVPPAGDEPRAVYDRLCELRARIPASVAPRRAAALAGEVLHLDPALPGFRYEDPLPCEARLPTTGTFARPTARLTVGPGTLRAECTCGAASCVHVLAAIDLALAWLRQPDSDRFRAALDALARPAWARTLVALDRALEESPAARAGIELSWRLSVSEGAGIEVAPCVHKLGKNGHPGAGTVVSRRRLLAEHAAKLAPADARIAALLPDDEGWASRAALEALLDHPRVVLQESPERAVRIERAAVGVVAEARNGAVRVTAGVDGTALPPALLDRVRKGRAEDVVFLWDGRTITLLDVKAELRALLEVLRREGDLFPPEAHGELLTALSKWSTHVPVTMPRSVRGEAAPARLAFVLRLEVESGTGGGGVHVEVRVRPLADGPALTPGEGPRDVHARRDTRAFHAVRDLRAETNAATALCALLPFDDAERLDRAYSFRYASAHGALDLLAACAALGSTGVAVPPELEWIGRPIRSVGRRGAASLGVSLQRRREWFGVLGGLAVDGDRVELARLLDAARHQERFVALDTHTYVELDAALRAHLAALADHVHETRHGLVVGPSAAETLQAVQSAGATLDADAAWRQLAARARAAVALDPQVPATLQATLRPYQTDGYSWLTRLAACGAGGVLADDMGLGKTVQALAVLLDRASRGPALVVAPTSVAFNWHEEARRFAPSLRLPRYADADDRGVTLAGLGPGDVLVTSYGLLLRDAAALATVPFATVFFDEAQHLKNAATQRARAARGLRAEATFALTGTPLENHLGELWSLYSVVFPTLLGSWEAFRVRFALPIERGLDPKAAPTLARLLAPFLLRRTKSQVAADLPPRTEVRVPVVLSGAEWELYEDARLAALSDLETPTVVLRKQERHVQVLAALTRLRLLASHPRLYDPASTLVSSKLARLLELVDELGAVGERALVFSQFTSHLALVREALDARGISYVYLDGQTPQGERGARVRAFQTGTAPLFLLSLKAGGVGLNLTAATTVIHLDPWWNPAVEDQASDRAHRLGQDRPVTIFRLVALGTIEEQMLALHVDKRALVARVLDGVGVEGAGVGGPEGAGIEGPGGAASTGAPVSTEELVGLLEAGSGRREAGERWSW